MPHKVLTLTFLFEGKKMRQFKKLLQCHLNQITITPNTVTFYFPPDNCCDAWGAIKVAKSLLKDVKKIDTYAGMRADTSYVLRSDKKWESISRFTL